MVCRGKWKQVTSSEPAATIQARAVVVATAGKVAGSQVLDVPDGRSSRVS